MIRKRNDSDGYRRGAMGIDDDKAGRFTKQNRTDPWTVTPASVERVRGDGVRRSDKLTEAGSGAYTSNDRILRNKMPDEDPEQGTEGRATGRDIWSDVEGQSSDDGNRAVKSRGND
jgi:hypothetical protein